ncbi:MAG: NUDIX hydrolase [Akkermansiaceae bacterium]|nr:NUDIX hydrolase [Akkermansiaceae bacterium]
METLYAGRFVNLVREGRWEFCERVNNTAAAMIFALTAEKRVLLVEEYRPPIRRQSICFPAGLVGDESAESAEAAARRELLEETGYAAEEMRFLFAGPSSPGITSEFLSFYLATGLRRVAAGGGVQGENITVHEIPLHEIESWLAAQQAAGKAIDPRIYTGLYFISRAQGNLITAMG